MKRILVVGLAIVTLGALTVILTPVLLGCVGTETITEPEAPAFEPTPTSAPVVVYQSITCDCCAEYVPYLKNKGFQVEVIYTEDRSSMLEKYQIPKNMWSCHTAIF